MKGFAIALVISYVVVTIAVRMYRRERRRWRGEE